MQVTGIMIDIETRSKINLKTEGAYKYAVHPSTSIICVSWTAFTADKRSKTYVEWTAEGQVMSDTFMKIYTNPDVELFAHNANFERLVMNSNVSCLSTFKGYSTLKPDRWVDTQHSCKAMNLPYALGSISECLHLADSKLDIGKKLISTYSSPDKKTGEFLDPAERKADWLHYCKLDNLAQLGVMDKLGVASPVEQELWRLDANMNDFGIPMDKTFVDRALAVIAVAQDKFSDAIRKLTGGIGPNQAVKFKAWLNENGVNVESTGKDILVDALRHIPMAKPVEQAVRLKLMCSKASIKKYKAMSKLMTDEVVRGGMNFCGATTTGRWSAGGMQPQNFPNGGKTGGAVKVKGEMVNLDTQAEDLLTLSPEGFFKKYSTQTLESLSFLLRSAIMAPEGKEFLVADYSAIEARVISWLCGEKEALAVFSRGECLYKAFAAVVFGLDPDEAQKMDKHDWRRAVCKEGELSLGYGTGHDSYGNKVFILTGEEVDIRCKCPKPARGQRMIHTCEAKRIVETFRNSKKGIRSMWKALELAVVSAYKQPKTSVKVGKHLSVIYTKGMLRIILPSGRAICYPGFKLEVEEDEAYTRLTMHYRGNTTGNKTKDEHADPNYKRWWRKIHLYAAKFLQNICQAVARDVMAEAMFRVDAQEGMQNSFTVHDEIIVVIEDGAFEARALCELMEVVPSWAKGLPLKVEGGITKRYCK